MKPGGLKALVLEGPMKGEDEAPDSAADSADDKPEGDDEALTAVGTDLLAAIAAKDAAGIGRAFKDAHDIYAGYGSTETDEG